MDQLSLAIRVVFSLAVVLAMMWALSRALRGRVPARGVPVDIVSRTVLGKRSSVAILRVGGRGLVVGVTDQTVTLLTEVELPAETTAPERRTSVRLSDTGADVVDELPDGLAPGPLAGSVLSPATWRRAAVVLRERTVRT